jgi:NADPH-dependent 2,4-dienoyl-CoA reductase/sulfur reductase-like enzyme
LNVSHNLKERYDVIIIGGGPAGMSAAINAKKFGASLLLIDENETLGGQLLEQTHKFFGSKEHYAGIRGYEIAKLLENILIKLKVDILIKTIVWNISNEKIFVSVNGISLAIKYRRIIFATGAKEKPIYFDNWTLPGVIYAGALQSLVNIYRVSPGKSVVIIGSGNVGLIIAYQLIQAGIKVRGIIESREKVGGYNVHENKIKRLGVPIFLSTKVEKAIGGKSVKGIEISYNGRLKKIFTELICIASGMLAQNDLLRLNGINFVYNKKFNDYIPKYNNNLQLTDNKKFFIAGDASGVEEASIAIEEGKMAGVTCCNSLGLITDDSSYTVKIRKTLSELRN